MRRGISGEDAAPPGSCDVCHVCHVCQLHHAVSIGVIRYVRGPRPILLILSRLRRAGRGKTGNDGIGR